MERACSCIARNENVERVEPTQSQHGPGYGYRIRNEPRNDNVTFDLPDHDIIRAADFAGVFYNGVEYRLDIGGRACDDAQDFGCCCLML